MTRLEVLTVCTGNICRSPLAMMLLSTVLRSVNVRCTSAGTRAVVGSPVTDETAALGRRWGVAESEIEAHRARQLEPSVLTGAHLVLTATRAQRRAVVEADPRLLRHTYTIREFARLAGHVPDDEFRRAAVLNDPIATVHALHAILAGQRSSVTLPDSFSDDDVTDPFGGSSSTYERFADEMIPPLARVGRTLLNIQGGSVTG